MNPKENLENESMKQEKLEKELLEAKKEISKLRKNLHELEKKEIIIEILPLVFHKLKNKLTPISGYCQILSKKAGDGFFKEKLGKIEKSTNDLTDLMNILRVYFECDKTLIERENLNSIIYGLGKHFANIEQTKNIKIDIYTDDKISDDLLNAGQIEALIINIVENSIHAIMAKNMQHGIITIKTVSKENMYNLYIRDNGIGISKENIFKIWTPFYSNFPGKYGIGLSICEKIIKNHGAVCNVDSVIGEYTEFQICFNNKEYKDF